MKKKCTIAIWSNLGGSQGHCAKGEKPMSKGHIVSDSTYGIPSVVKFQR